MHVTDFLRSPAELMLVMLFASSLALGACLWLVWHEMMRQVRRDRRMLRDTETYLHQQLAALNEKLSGEMARQRQEAEQVERSLETAVRRRLDELSALIESLRQLEAKLETRNAAPAAAAPADPAAGTVAKEVRGGLSVIGRPPKT